MDGLGRWVDDHPMFAVSSSARLVAGVAAFAGLVACSSSPHDVANPFSGGFEGAHIAINRVVCQPTPDTCERVIVLSPSGIGRAELIRRVEARVVEALRWRPTRYREVVERDEGDVFDGKTNRHGGSVDAAQPELRFWERTGWAQEVPPDHDEQAVLAATRATPEGVVVTIR